MQYFPAFEEEGIHTTLSPFFDDRTLSKYYEVRRRSLPLVLLAMLRRLAAATRCRGFDLIWVEKELFPYLPAWAEKFLSLSGLPYLVDYDDAIFHNYDLHPSRLVRGLLGAKIARIMCKAAVVLVGNDYLAEYAKAAGAKRVELLPTVVDLNRYTPRAKTSCDEFRIGWIGSPASAKCLNVVEEVFPAFTAWHKSRLVLVGVNTAKLSGIPIEFKLWTEESEVRLVQDFDVGIMPLPDAPWERGKCGYKLIQYMACGLPVVASPVGVNRHIVEHGVSGFLAENPVEWVEALSRLRDDPTLRERMGAAGRARVEREFSLQVTAPRLIATLRSVAR